MKNLLQYAGTLVVLLTTVLLAATFFTDMLIDADTNHLVLGISALLIIVGIALAIIGGRMGNKIKD